MSEANIYVKELIVSKERVIFKIKTLMNNQLSIFFTKNRLYIFLFLKIRHRFFNFKLLIVNNL